MQPHITRTSSWRRIVRFMLLSLLLPVLLALLSMVLLLYLLQGRMVFMPQHTRLTEEQLQLARQVDAQELTVEGDGGVHLHGFLLPGEGEGPRPAVVYFGGNAEHVGRELQRFQGPRRLGWTVVLVAYRGYGRSEGSPTSAGLLADSLHVYDLVAGRPDIDADRIVTWGRSLGTGVAVHVAAHRPVAGVILATPYTRLSDVAAYHYPWLPVRLLFRHEIDSISRAPDMATPALLLHGDLDRVIPYQQAVTLQERWQPRPRLVTLEGWGHNSLQEDPAYEREILAFLGAR